MWHTHTQSIFKVLINQRLPKRCRDGTKLDALWIKLNKSYAIKLHLSNVCKDNGHRCAHHRNSKWWKMSVSVLCEQFAKCITAFTFVCSYRSNSSICWPNDRPWPQCTDVCWSQMLMNISKCIELTWMTKCSITVEIMVAIEFTKCIFVFDIFAKKWNYYWFVNTNWKNWREKNMKNQN